MGDVEVYQCLDTARTLHLRESDGKPDAVITLSIFDSRLVAHKSCFELGACSILKKPPSFATYCHASFREKTSPMLGGYHRPASLSNITMDQESLLSVDSDVDFGHTLLEEGRHQDAKLASTDYKSKNVYHRSLVLSWVIALTSLVALLLQQRTWMSLNRSKEGFWKPYELGEYEDRFLICRSLYCRSSHTRDTTERARSHIHGRFAAH